MANTEKIVDALDDANEILSKFIPLIPNFMGIIGLFISKPSVNPEVRRAAIASMRSTFTKVIVEADAWLEANGYDENGNKKAQG
jgi:uncharacterized membrane protein (GlpM family)